MPVKNFLIDKIDYSKFCLIAIYTNLVDYRLAYHLNKSLRINLKRNTNDIDFNLRKGVYSYYEYEDDGLVNWSLISNRYFYDKKIKNIELGLFNETKFFRKSISFISEREDVSFFLKVEDNISKIKLNKLITDIRNISNIISAHELDINKLKSKNNLNF